MDACNDTWFNFIYFLPVFVRFDIDLFGLFQIL